MESKSKKEAPSKTYDEIKKEALANPLVRILVRLSEIKIIADNVISYKGHTLHFTESAFKSLGNLILPLGFQDRVNSAMGATAKLHFINTMRDAISSQTNKQVMFVGNPATATIVSIASNTGMLSTQSFFDLTEGIISKYGLSVKNCSINNIGDVAITTTSPKDAIIKGLDSSYKTDESFFPGLAFQNSIVSGTSLNPFTIRQICSNGMIGVDRSAIVRINGFDSKELQVFYEKVKMLASNNFVDFGYSDKVIKAINTLASLGELQFAAKHIENSVVNVGSKLINSLVPYYTCADKYAKMGYNVEKLSKQQLASAKTNVSVWHAVNAMTDFASHSFDDVDMSGSSRVHVQQMAGALLNKRAFDTEQLMPSIL